MQHCDTLWGHYGQSGYTLWRHSLSITLSANNTIYGVKVLYVKWPLYIYIFSKLFPSAGFYIVRKQFTQRFTKAL